MIKNPTVVPVFVSDHARERARERFPGFKGAKIIEEVREALKAGRISSEAPGRIPYSDCLYCWSDERIYPLVMADNGFVVTTCLPRPPHSITARGLAR